jgi:hypothetical protein
MQQQQQQQQQRFLNGDAEGSKAQVQALFVWCQRCELASAYRAKLQSRPINALRLAGGPFSCMAG